MESFYIEYWQYGDPNRSISADEFRINAKNLKYFLRKFVEGNKRTVVGLIRLRDNKTLIDRKG